MPFFDLPLEELQRYLPPRSEPDDFDAFWTATLSESRQHSLNAAFTPYATDLRQLEVFDVSYAGWGGQTVRAWLLLPAQRGGPLPCVVHYIGYGGGRGLPLNWLSWPSAGYAFFVMDTRGQGSNWLHGDTPDDAGSDPQAPGFMTRGVRSPQTYYYRRVYTDAVRAVEAARSHPAVDSGRIAVTGASQGGGITLAVAGLLGEGVQAAMPDVPFLCHFRRATQIIATMPYTEISNYLKTHRTRVEETFHTLSYFDGVNFAARARVPALFSVGLMDDICPPSTVYAAYNHYAGPKAMRIYEYNNHEGGGIYQQAEQIRWLNAFGWLD